MIYKIYSILSFYILIYPIISFYNYNDGNNYKRRGSMKQNLNLNIYNKSPL
jgi:hypothetical protein